MISKGRHPKNSIAQALDGAREASMVVTEVHKGHRWGVVRCACGADFAVWSTPRNADTHAKQVDRFVAKHRACVTEQTGEFEEG
ncbi:hypothetical protein GCM10009547_25660 [Sporichthya brevicatena]|uniref:Uncharacterized protein n=1 Tax=Sporichthya brevicatena TaxID=171442 RepID=A0ABN1GX35_9ACTN